MNNQLNYRMIAEQMMKNPQLANNKIVSNAYNACLNGKSEEVNSILNNICKEKNISKENLNVNNILSSFLGIR
jgi:hypothetical protein